MVTLNPVDNSSEDLDYLRSCLEAAPFTPLPWDGEDRNLGAFSLREAMVDWYSQPPGLEGQSYRDRGFYCRELAMLSRIIQPKTVVEFGTSLGIGTCLLRWLNPTARLVTVDINTITFMPGDVRVPIGYVAQRQWIDCEYVTSRSWEFAPWKPAGLCFIDADHSYEAVLKDSIRALSNSLSLTRWAIAWHDHNDRHPGVMQAVAEFCAYNNLKLQSRPDSDTVWVWRGVV